MAVNVSILQFNQITLMQPLSMWEKINYFFTKTELVVFARQRVQYEWTKKRTRIGRIIAVKQRCDYSSGEDMATCCQWDGLFTRCAFTLPSHAMTA